MKRLIDVSAALVLLVLLAPVMALVAAAILFDLGAPVLFRQQRPGLRGTPFTLVKFRTMRQPAAGEPQTSTDGERLTRFGRWLRATSLDEIPELWNVLRGDMSLVGPRPLLMHYLSLYTPEQMRRHDVRPGLTGWAQVNGRNAVCWEEKFALDLWYVDHRSFALDFKILLLTFGALVKREGITHDNAATMPEFTGAMTSPPAQNETTTERSVKQ